MQQEADRAIGYMTITDVPRFGWRAFMLDEGRYFQGMDQVKKLLNEMARLKMNIFHWHLVDDQSWRLEIRKYPLLIEIGSKRPSTQVGPRVKTASIGGFRFLQASAIAAVFIH